MSVKLKITEPDGIYSITITCFKWIPLFSIADSYDAVYKWFQYLNLNIRYITGYVIMAQPFTCIDCFLQHEKNSNQIIGYFRG